MRGRAALLTAACAELVAAAPATAHHASSGLYDRSATAVVSGEVSAVFWRNPHVRLTLTVGDADGAGEIWEIEAGSVNTLERMGVSENEFAIGVPIEVSGYPGREGRRIMFASAIRAADGRELPLGSDINRRYARPDQIAAGEALDRGPAADIFRVWVPTSVPNTGAGGADFPLTETALAARAAWDPADDPVLKCIAPGMPAAMDNPYPVAFEAHEDRIILRLEEWDGIRTIHLRASDPDPAPSPMGYSTGRWNGNTLVVETTAIDYPYFDDLGTPQSRSIRVTERFRLNPEERRLSWQAEIEDAENFTEAVRMRIEWQWIPGHELKPFDCVAGIE